MTAASSRHVSIAVGAALALGLTILPAGAASAAPVNDDLADAAPITLGTTVVDLVDATVEPGEPTLCVEYDPDTSSYFYSTTASAWYSFTSEAAQTIQGSITDDQAEPSASAHVFRQVGGTLESITCADSHDRSAFFFQAAAGEQFLIQVGSLAGAPPLDEATLFLGSLPAIPNTAPQTAIQLAIPSITSQSTIGTDYELVEPYGCEPIEGAIMNDVWYRITAPATGPLTVDLTDSDFDVTFAVYRDQDLSAPVACPPLGSPVDGYPGIQAAIATFPASAGESFLIQVGGFYFGTGTAVVSVSQAPSAPPTVTRTAPVIGPRAGGTAVTVTGTGFTPDATVTFGGVPATSVTYVSATKLVATSPRVASPRLVEVMVTTPAGTSPKALLAKFLYLR